MCLSVPPCIVPCIVRGQAASGIPCLTAAAPSHYLLAVSCPPSPLPPAGLGILVCMATTFLATDFKPARVIAEIEHTLKMQLIVSTLIMTPVSAKPGRCLGSETCCTTQRQRGYHCTADDLLLCLLPAGSVPAQLHWSFP
jgi:hypothetical protein